MTSVLIMICIVNSILLILHEIESAYENEWKILHLPGDISLFLLIHIPILILFFLCPIGILLGIKGSYLISLMIGIGGMIPLIIHKLLIFKKDAFNRMTSNVIIYGNSLIGLVQIVITIYEIKINNVF